MSHRLCVFDPLAKSVSSVRLGLHQSRDSKRVFLGTVDEQGLPIARGSIIEFALDKDGKLIAMRLYASSNIFPGNEVVNRIPFYDNYREFHRAIVRSSTD